MFLTSKAKHRGEIGEGYKNTEDKITINVTTNSIMDGGDTVLAASPIAKPANHDPSASIASPDPDADADPDPDPNSDPELAPLPNISVPEDPEYPIPYSDPDPDSNPDSDPYS